MATYNGVMAGIGDIEQSVNIIDPQFDAKVNNFIVGADGILSGMELNGSVLSSGICIAKGYRGSIDTNITLDTTDYIYGVFKVNHDSDILDEFYIQTSSSPLDEDGTGNSFGDDILHEAGTYYLRLNQLKTETQTSEYEGTTSLTSSSMLSSSGYYEASRTNIFTLGDIQNVELNSATPSSYVHDVDITYEQTSSGNWQIHFALQATRASTQVTINYTVTYTHEVPTENTTTPLNYPVNAENSENTDKVNAHGTIGNGTTAVTQSVNDNSTKIATTAYVHNMIDSKINAADANYTSTKIFSLSDVYDRTATFNITTTGKRRAKLCVIELTLVYTCTTTTENAGSISANTVLGNIPEEFYPNEEVDVGTMVSNFFLGGSSDDVPRLKINTNGEIYADKTVVCERDTEGTTYTFSNIGYYTEE